MQGVKGQTKSKNRLRMCKIVDVGAKLFRQYGCVPAGELGTGALGVNGEVVSVVRLEAEAAYG